jgi:membrane-bound lytic murein transglycosylase B
MLGHVLIAKVVPTFAEHALDSRQSCDSVDLMRASILALPLLLVAATGARADFDSCVAGLRSAAAAKGVSGATFDRAMARWSTRRRSPKAAR